MGEPIKLQDDFSLGMRRDDARDAMPSGAVWGLRDYLLNLGAPLRKRGGWTYGSNALTSARAGSSDTFGYHVGFFDKTTAAPVLIIVDSEGFTYSVNLSSGVPTQIGSPSVSEVIGTSFVHRDLWLGSTGASGNRLRTWDGSTFTITSAPYPTSRGGCVYKDYSVIVDGTDLVKLGFSDPGNPTSWTNYADTSFFNFSAPVRAAAALRDAIFVFTDEHMSRLRGNFPPPGTDMILEDPFYPQGVYSQVNPFMAVTQSIDEVVWANAQGVFITDGAAIEDLTWLGGMRSYWQELIDQMTATGSIALGYHNGYLFVTLHSAQSANSATLLDTLCCDVSRRVWFRLKNIPAFDYVTGVGEAYFGISDANRAGSLASIFDPDGQKADADGDAVVPELETPFYLADPPGRKSWKRLYLTHRTKDAASDNPIQTVSYIKTPHETSYTALARTIDEAADMARVRRDLGFSSLGVAFKIVQSNASLETQIYDIEAEVHPRSASSL